MSVVSKNIVLSEPELDLLRRKLVSFFCHNAAREPEDLAQETIMRLLAKLRAPDLVLTVPVSAFAFGIAKNVWREQWAEHSLESLDDSPAPQPPDRRLHLTEARTLLSQIGDLVEDPADWDLLVQYFGGDRTLLAEELGKSPGALRLTIFRIKQALLDAMKRKPSGGRKA